MIVFHVFMYSTLQKYIPCCIDFFQINIKLQIVFD